MSIAGKTLRLSRFLGRHSRRGVIVPIDHGLTLGPIAGLESVSRMGEWLIQPGINGIIAHKGVAERLASRGLLHGLGLMVHLNGMPASAADPNRKEMVASIGAAQRLGADGVSVQINFDGTNDSHNIRLLGGVTDAAQNAGLPVLAMVYDKRRAVADDERVEKLRQLMRLAIELGADALKIAPPENLADVGPILADLASDAAVFFAGGTVMADDALCALAREAVRHDAAGLCVGRNVFQRPVTATVLGRLGEIIHGTPEIRRVHGPREVRYGAH